VSVSQAQWSDLRADYTFSFGYEGCKWRCDRVDNITLHSAQELQVLHLTTVRLTEKNYGLN